MSRKRKLKPGVKKFLTLVKRLIVLILLVGIGLTVYAMLEPADNNATPITADYTLIKENSRSVYIVRSADDVVIVPSIVISYATNKNYIAVRHTEVPASDDIKPDFTKYSYWLISPGSSTPTGPLTDEQFSAAIADKNLNFDEWTGT